MSAHGTRTRYAKGCRCADCKASNAIYQRERQRRAAPTRVKPGRAREHLAWLASEGVGLRVISERSGVNRTALQKIVNGTTQRISVDTERKILGVLPADQAGGALVDAVKTWEHVATLLSRGWTKAAISGAIGQGGRALQLRPDRVTRRNADAVAALLDVPSPDGSWTPEVEVARRREAMRDEARRAAAAEARAYYRHRGDEPAERVVLDESWRRRAACRPGVLPAEARRVFFAARDDHEGQAAARRICSTCPVAEDCADYAVAAGMEAGVWGGRSVERLRRERRAS